MEDLNSRWKGLAYATVVLLLIAMVGCQGLSAKQDSAPPPASSAANPLGISGSISPASSGSGATVTLDGPIKITATADSSGNYSFSNLANGSYTVAASKSGVTFSPTSVQVTVDGAQVTGVNFTASSSTGSQNTFTISGTISPAANGSGTTVTLGGASSATTTTNSSGVYSFTGLANGSYTITASKSGFTFSPSSLQVTINGANVTDGNFVVSAVPPNTFSISGTISPAASGSGVTVTLAGAAAAATTANSSGAYSFTGLANGSYTITASKSGFTFTPSSLQVTLNGANLTGENFTASAITYSISGSISSAANGSGATVKLAGAASATTTANSSGGYSFTGLASGSYTITASKSGFTFSPSSLAVTVSGANVTGENFTASAVPPTTYSISGTISSAANGSGATVKLAGAASTTTTANSSGGYSFTGLASGSYTITASKSGFTFSPSSLAVTVSGANVTGENFTASAVPPTTYSISGSISSAANGSGATVKLAGAASATTTANSSGGYSFTGLPNGSYTITASKSGFTFSPSSLAVTVSGANVTGENFTASAVPPTPYSISGSISSAANGSGATVKLAGAASATTTANSSGAYSFTGLANGSYTITASKSGFTFSPSSLAVTVSGANVTGENFTASAVPPTTYSISGSISSAANGSGATVKLAGAASATTTANSSGAYSFTGLANGSYTITASKSGFTFSPSSLAVTVSGANVTGENFTASAVPPTTYSISGSISSAANGSGATVKLAGAASATTTANSSGGYSFTGLASGSYTITASKSGFTFSPSSLAVTVSGANVTGENFTASAVPPTTYSISGSISSAANGSGATVKLAGAASATTTANSSGAYSFTGLANGSYTITASKSGFTFSPSSLQVTVSGANATGENFTASAITYSISGTISTAANGSGATVKLAGAASATTTANGSGAYSFTGLANGSYTITASKAGFTFSPFSLAVTVSGANVTGENFTASAVPPTTYSISGTISSGSNGSGATLTLSGSGSTTTTASASGGYSFTGLANGSYVVTPRKSGFTFSPTSMRATVSGANVTGMNFTTYAGAVVSISPGTVVQSVVEANPAGTTFVFQPGTYRLPGPINPKSGDSFVGQTACAPPASSCPAILSGSRIIGNLAVYDGTNYEVTGQTQQGVQQYTTKCDPGQEGCFYPEDLFFDGVPLQHLYATSLPTILTGQWWFDYTNHIIYFHDNPSGHTVETSVVPTVVEVPSGTGVNDITFQYLTIEEFAAPLEQGGVDPMPLGGTNPHQSLDWLVENCELLLNHGLGVHINYGMHVLNSYIHNNGQMGVGGGTDSATLQSGVLVSGNTVTHNNYANVNPNFGAGGIKFGDTLGAVVRGNTVTNNGGAGIHFDTDSRSPLIDGNTVTDNIGGSGIIYEVSLVSAVVRNNILQRNGATDAFGNGPAYNLVSADSVGVNAYCNLVEVNNLTGENGLIANASNRGDDPNPPHEYLTSTGNYFHHNTVIWDAGADGNVGYMQGDVTNQPNFFANNTPPDYNTYHQSSLSATDFVYDDNDTGSNARKTFAEYQASGAEVNGTADTNYTSGFPTVAVTSPVDQSSVTTPVTVEAAASDASGISKVEFYVDWSLQATVSSSPYNFDWTTATTGAHTIAAMAYSNAGIRNCYAVTLNEQ